jgi:DNA replication ATP-dependent helicase Dna2
VYDFKPEAVEGHAFDEGVSQTGNTMWSSNARTPERKRKALGEVGGNAKGVKKRSPGKVVTAGKRGVLEGRPVLRDVYNGAM